MTVNQKPSGRAVSMPRGLVMGGVTSLTTTLVLTALYAKLMESGTMGEGQIGYWVMGMLLGGSFFGSMVAVSKVKRQRLMVCLLSGLVYFLMLMSITALFFGGQYAAVGVTGILVMGGSLLPVLVSGQKPRAGKGRHRKSGYR